MQFTMLDPRGAATATATLEPPANAKPEWHNEYKFGYEEVEAPWKFRYAQIGVGISSYFFMSRLAIPLILLPVAFAVSDLRPNVAAGVILTVWLVLYCLSAVWGGAVAGFWARNWLPQGLGVAAGVLLIPLMFMIAFVPESWPKYCMTLGFTSVFTIFGAFLGHLLVRPTRIPRS